MSKFVSPPPGVNPWVQYGLYRIKNNQNWLAFTEGPTGSGKSWFGLWLCEQLSKQKGIDFNIDNVLFDGEELLKLAVSGKLKRGSALLVEELGVMASHRKWQSKINIALLYLFQTFRRDNNILIMNAPSLKLVDKSVRELFHTLFQTQAILKSKGLALLKAHNLQFNSRKPDPYKHALFVAERGSDMQKKINFIMSRKPSKELLKQYEDKKKKYVEELKIRMLATVQAPKTRETYFCNQCEAKWVSRSPGLPIRCPKCDSKDWNGPKALGIAQFPRKSRL